jgi:hypothetical protein
MPIVVLMVLDRSTLQCVCADEQVAHGRHPLRTAASRRPVGPYNQHRITRRQDYWNPRWTLQAAPFHAGRCA